MEFLLFDLLTALAIYWDAYKCWDLAIFAWTVTNDGTNYFSPLHMCDGNYG